MIEAKGLTKVYGTQTILKDVSFVLNPAEILIITGDNGVGKTTLLSILATMTKPTAGDILLQGKSLIDEPRQAIGKVAYIPQGIMLNMNLSTMDTLCFWAAVNKLDKKATAIECERLIKLLNLQPFLKTKIKHLSAGTKRRVNIAVSLFMKPQYLLMDEPTAGLDSPSRMELIDFTKHLAESGTAVVYVTHLQDEIPMLGENIKLLKLIPCSNGSGL